MSETRQFSQAEIDAAWEAEIERRVAAYERGEYQLYPAEEVFAEVRRRLKEKKEGVVKTLSAEEIFRTLEASLKK